MSNNRWVPPQQPQQGGQYPQYPAQYAQPGQFAPPPAPWQPSQYGGPPGPNGRLPQGLGWGPMPPGGPRPPRKKNPAKAAVIVIGVLGVGILMLAAGVAGLRKVGGELSAPPVPTSGYSPTIDPTGAATPRSSPSQAVSKPTKPVPSTTRPTSRPTAPRTTTTPKQKPGPTDYEIVSRNRLYAAGVVTSVGCRESRARQSTTAGARANYVQLRACLNRTWPAAVQRTGSTFRPPTVMMFTGVITTPCGTNNDSGPPFYCGSNETIYMNLTEDIGNYNRYSQSYQKVWARMWMLHQFAHEYGHHVQNLTGILDANWDLRYDAPTRAAQLELSRRLELQASCFSDIFIGANKNTYPVKGQSYTQWAWLIGNVTDLGNDHGDAPNHRYWALRGYNSRNPASCNTFTASSTRVR